MLGEELEYAVGPGKPNHPDDVRIVQRLLDRSGALIGGIVRITGNFDQATAAAIFNFQRRVMRAPFATGIINPGDETYWRLAETSPRRMLAGARRGIILAPFSGNGHLTQNDFTAAANSLGCEIRAIKAVATVESHGGAFDIVGRPTILFERHLFSKLTHRQYDGRYPTISNPSPGGYSFPERDQWVRLQQAYALNASLALQSTSWGLFQILGSNYIAAGFGTVDEFVRAMCHSAREQLDAFVAFIEADSSLLTAIRSKDWKKFAFSYNGRDYRKNLYDTRLEEAYAHAQN